MVENNVDRNPELALMGSCVLVMLMKDQDVYVMNLGDSCVILAQERPNGRHPNPSFVKDDARHKNRSRESLEVFRIKAEHPDDNQAILNDRVKGQLKVSRAFGVGALSEIPTSFRKRASYHTGSEMSKVSNFTMLDYSRMDFHELLDIPHGERRKYHDDVSVMVVSLEGRIWRSSG
ncbi:unnamed protein product [Lupinus luteus]|uniref:PPM-type phosphatase domain-containing protein n=1 Tax=Lupinus luteus TaxID=3873 RepID=A0AAV1X588_LUPLU